MAARRRGAARTEPVTPSEGGSSRLSRWHAAAAPAQPGTAPPRGRFGRQERGLPAPHRPAARAAPRRPARCSRHSRRALRGAARPKGGGDKSAPAPPSEALRARWV